jgi:polyvinyl alcohol dehydrogenase (cytochrome)
MDLRRNSALLWLILVISPGAVIVNAQTPSGEVVFQQHCAGCHDQQNPRIPTREALRKLSAVHILRTLNSGEMIAVGYTMTVAEREAVANYLGIPGGDEPLPASAFCKVSTVKVPAHLSAAWNGWSPGTSNTRYQTADAAGLSIESVKRLKLKWAFAFPGDVTAFAPPTILDQNLFVGSAGGLIFALDRDSGCIHWKYQGGGAVRSAIVAVRDAGHYVLLFGDQNGWFYELDAASGKLRWKKKMEDHDAARVTGAPAVYAGNVFVPVAGWEENRAADPKYPCCTMRGSVTALRIHDGGMVWKTYMVEPSKETGKNSVGTPTFGPSGVAVWSAPTLDVERGVLYAGTGNNYTLPVSELSDSIVALDLHTGQIKWSRQLTPGDVFNGSCTPNSGCGPDFDFGSSVMLVKTGTKSVLVAGQKSGVVYGLDPDHQGEVLWQLRVGKGGTNGGVEWGMASDGQNAYAAVSDVARVPRKPTDLSDLRERDLDPNVGGGLTAIWLANGTKVWFAPSLPCDPPRPGCSPAQPSAVTAFPGVVFAGSVNGHLRAYASEDGKVLWDFDTAREFETVNGVKGHGGSIDGPGAIVVKGTVFVTSGYVRQSEMQGNVLLAFTAE